MPLALKSGSLNLPKPYGPVWVCNGIALPLPYPQVPDNLAMPLCVSGVMWDVKSHFQLCGSIFCMYIDNEILFHSLHTV
jgi:hypothetical protein